MKRILCAVFAMLVMVPEMRGHAQAPSPVADALRATVAEVGPNIVLAAEGMATGKYTERAYAFAPTFGETVTEIANFSALYCEQLTGVTRRLDWSSETRNRDSIVVHLKASLAYCATALAKLDDTRLADTIRFDGLKTRATVMREFVALLPVRYQYLTLVMRQQGVVPPMKCTGAGGPVDCGSGVNLCVPHQTPFVQAPLMAILADSGYAVRSDGKGPYRRGTSNVQVAAVGRAAVMVLGKLGLPADQRRAVVIDLSKPVVGSGAVSLGEIRDDQFMEVAGQWESDPDTHVSRSITELPIGASVKARQIDVEFDINGEIHTLQAGPQPIGHCYSDRTAVHGTGTSTGTISHPDADTWIVDLPPGSIARLFNVDKKYPFAVDRGLYHVSLRLTLRKAP